MTPPSTAMRPRASDRLRTRAQEALWAASAGTLSLLIAVWVLRVWDAALRVPLAPHGDALPVIVAVKSLIENGSFLTNPDMGAPFTSELHDFGGMGGDLLQWTGMRILGLAISDPVVIVNVWFMMGFFVIGAASYAVLRDLRIDRLPSLVLAVLLAVLPYHFFQGEPHLALAGYVAVPAAGWLVMRTLLGRPLTSRAARPGWRRLVTPRNGLVVAACATAGGTALYYAVFTLILLGAAIVLRLMLTRRIRSVRGPIIAWGAVVATLVVTFIPALAYRVQHGSNPAAAPRLAFESDVYSFGLGQLLFSSWWHRVPFIADLGARYQQSSVNFADPNAYVGMVFGITFIGALVALAVMTLRGSWPNGRMGAQVRASAIAAGGTFLIGTFGGVGSIIAHLVSPQIRVWTRVTPFLAFFCAVLLGSLLTVLARRTAASQRWRWLAIVAPLAIGVLGVADQTSPALAPDHAANAVRWNTTRAFVREVERVMPPQAMILQLPLVPYPEGVPINGMEAYDHLLGPIHSSELRWSFGAMKGRPEDWSSVAIERGLSNRQVVTGAAGAGFSGVWVDRAAYENNGAGIDLELRRMTGQGPSVTAEGERWALYDLRPLRAALIRTNGRSLTRAAGVALVKPVLVQYGPGFEPEEGGTDGSRWRWMGNRAALMIDNPAKTPQRMVWTAGIRGAANGRVKVSYQGVRIADVRLVEGRGQLHVAIPARSGRSVVTVRAVGSNQAGPDDPRLLITALEGATIVSPALDISP